MIGAPIRAAAEAHAATAYLELLDVLAVGLADATKTRAALIEDLEAHSALAGVDFVASIEHLIDRTNEAAAIEAEWEVIRVHQARLADLVRTVQAGGCA